MANFNDKNELKKQYATSDNLNHRILLHQQYSTNKLGWANWVFQNYTLKAKQTILELGCGNGGIWKGKAENIPDNIKLTLSDISAGMLESAKTNTEELSFVDYKVIDIQSIPYGDNSFDIVIANHMLYHVKDIKKALKEISRILKPDGIFYATTIGKNNFKELINILNDFDSKINFAQDSITKAFCLESGTRKLSQFFSSVEIKRYEDSLHITDPKPLIDYVLSSIGIGNINDIIIGEKISQFNGYIFDLFSINGYIDIFKDAGIFIAKNPIK